MVEEVPHHNSDHAVHRGCRRVCLRVRSVYHRRIRLRQVLRNSDGSDHWHIDSCILSAALCTLLHPDVQASAGNKESNGEKEPMKEFVKHSLYASTYSSYHGHRFSTIGAKSRNSSDHLVVYLPDARLLNLLVSRRSELFKIPFCLAVSHPEPDPYCESNCCASHRRRTYDGEPYDKINQQPRESRSLQFTCKCWALATFGMKSCHQASIACDKHRREHA
mmetsp:Transcript_3616/g.10059  ORF Transcript_3616/g.10059 Transcript_3616/m.10059 type:complete len:220 (+) Transcript_3616:588-1247(+)